MIDIVVLVSGIQQNDSVIYKFIYTFLPPGTCAIQWDLVIYFIYSSLYLPIPPPLSSLGTIVFFSIFVSLFLFHK